MDDDDQNARAIVARVDGDVPLGAASAEDEDGAGHEGADSHGGDGDDEAEGGDPHDAGDDEPPAGFDPADPALTECASQPMNDIGNGRRLLRRHGRICAMCCASAGRVRRTPLLPRISTGR
ncbi:hypothetical protein ABB55_27750 [Prosthecomicrobium hirschii]|uniref:Uncharacterized protein n=1 Tax=Prosthecodimorpha hirschii TaxID=665126 RepID=A0A0N8GFX8_9HYPH|nr:hypothetical protein [Prosthecomicrobium hirschii]KPL55561.1 hypothetical protein ABB55_27750 [Prosthecomicrobium hirschii]